MKTILLAAALALTGCATTRVTADDLARANATADPLGALIAAKGW